MNKNQTHINLGGEEVPVKYEKRDIFELRFYPENPRILSIIKQKPEMKNDEKMIEKELWDDRDETHRLYRSIEKQGGLIHPVIVNKNYVLEGNTRLCCYRHLYEESNKNEKWRFIDCEIILDEGLSKEKIDILLGNEHIVGKIEWDTFEKGCWMSKMFREDNYKVEDISERIGKSEKWIQDHIWAYERMLKEKIQDKSKFSHFVQIVSNGEIAKIAKNKDKEIINKIVKFIKNDQVPTAQDIRKIPKVWSDKRSRKKIESGEKIDEVFYKLKAEDPTVSSSFLNDAQALTEKMRNLKLIKRDEIKESDKGKFIVSKLAAEVNKLCRDLRIKA